MLGPAAAPPAASHASAVARTMPTRATPQSLGADGSRETAGDEVGDVRGDPVGHPGGDVPLGPFAGRHDRRVDDEPVDLRVVRDQAQVGRDDAADDGPRVVGGRVPGRPAEVADDRGVDPLGDGGVEAGAVGEVPVEHGLRRSRGGRDLVHADARAVLPDGVQGRLDQLLAPGEAVLVPAGAASVRCRVGRSHAPDGSRNRQYLLPSVPGTTSSTRTPSRSTTDHHGPPPTSATKEPDR